MAYLVTLGVLLSIPQVTIEFGHLSLSGIAIGASALVLSPLNATLVGLASSWTSGRRRDPHLANRVHRLVGNAAYFSTMAFLSAVVAGLLRTDHGLALDRRIAVLVVAIALNVLVVGCAFWSYLGGSLWAILRRNLSPSFALAFGYFSLAALLISYLLDGSALGFLLATIVCVLALALTDTIAGRRLRVVLESELSDADRHLFQSRAIEGVVHNLRNHMANAVGYLKEIDPRRLDPIDRSSLETAAAAATDAVEALRSLAHGASPRVSYSLEPVDLNELVTRAVGMARPRARTKEIQLAVRESGDDVRVRADPLLLREVATNLVNNAIDAAPVGGRVELASGRQANGSPFFSVADNGPGVSAENRPHLFEPHYTTKEGGTGLGLFMSYGIVREHQGQLLLEGSRRGAVFTVILPPFSS